MNFQTSAGDEQKVWVTAIISRRVRAGCEKAFEEWLQGISQAAAQFPGHQGVSILRPHDPANPEYVVILKFDAVPHLREWLKSEIRREWIERSNPLTETPDKVTELTGLKPWFTLPGQPLRTPPRWKMFLLTLLAAYPLIMIVTALFGPWLGQSGPWVGHSSPWLFNFVVTVALTTLLTYLAMPLVTRLFYAWLYPKDRH